MKLDLYTTQPTNLKINDVEMKKKAIDDKLNRLLEGCRLAKYSHLWIVDADIEVPDWGLQALLDLDADVATGVYPFHGDANNMVGGRLGPTNKIMYCTRSHLKGKILGAPRKTPRGMIPEPVAAGNGCLLLKRSIPEAGFHFKSERSKGGSDIRFFREVQKSGAFKVRLHGDLICGHLPEWPLEMIK